MPATSSNAGFVLPTNAGDSGLWGNELNASIASLDTRVAGTATVLSSVSGLSYTISSAQAQCSRLVLGGVPAGPATWNFSSANYAMGEYAVWNTSTGFDLTLQTPGGGATCTVPAGSQRVVTTDGTNAYFADQVPIPTFTFPPLLSNYLSNLTLSNDPTTPNTVMDYGPGLAADATNLVYMQSTGTFTKNATVPWVAGSSNGGLGVGLSFSAATTYHHFMISNGVSSAIDFYMDTSPTAANKPANTNYFRRVGSRKTLSSGAVWAPTIQNGDYVYHSPVIEYNSAAARIMSALSLVGVPTGIVVQPIFTTEVVSGGSGGAVSLNLAPVTQLGWSYLAAVTEGAAGAGAAGGGTVLGPPTNLSGQVGMGVTVNISVAAAQLFTIGYIDRRGQDGGL